MNRAAFGTARLAIAVAVLSNPSWAWQERLSREGAFWVQAVSGSEAAFPGGRLRVSTTGRVSVTGSDEAAVQYQFVKKVRARTEAEARKLLGQFLIRAGRQADLTSIEVIHGAGNGSTELMVRTPRRMRDILVDTRGGAVDATDLDGSLQVHTGGGRIRLDRIGGAVVARTAGGEVQLGKISGPVRCISAGGIIRADQILGETRFETAGGDIAVREVQGKFVASTAGGGIRIGRAGAAVSVNTAGGQIHVGSATGAVLAESLGGPIFIGSAAGVRCETGGGAIQVTNVSGSLHATTSVGDIVASLARGDIAADSYVSTGAGDITIFLPDGLGLTIQAQNRSLEGLRRIISEFPNVTVRRQGSLTVAEGSINGGGPLLRLSGSGGTIYIKRQE
ncbi:MAG: hypothetical protein ACKV22_13995 [Bryobacteraceae bacterium]